MTITSVDLKADAIAEAARLAHARAVAAANPGGDVDHAHVEGPLVARARRCGVRQALAGRVLTIWRIAYEDPSGRIVESRLVPALVAVPAQTRIERRRRWIRTLLRGIDAPVRRFVDSAEPAWRAAAIDAAARFAAARTSRERAIAACSARERRQLFQPGLFDRRSQRAREREDNTDADLERQARARVDATAAAGRLTPRDGELLLVLTP